MAKKTADVMRKSLESRFFSRVCKGAEEECWQWTGQIDKRGYGRLWAANIHPCLTRMSFAHRVSYYISKGTIPDNINILHKCDNPNCVNPNHLFPGTLKQNTQDMLEKNRHFHKAKVTCPLGHAYDEENTYYYKNNRQCRKCSIERSRRYRNRIKKTAISERAMQ